MARRGPCTSTAPPALSARGAAAGDRRMETAHASTQNARIPLISVAERDEARRQGRKGFAPRARDPGTARSQFLVSSLQTLTPPRFSPGKVTAISGHSARSVHWPPRTDNEEKKRSSVALTPRDTWCSARRSSLDGWPAGDRLLHRRSAAASCVVSSPLHFPA